uniref:Uncharacterized protein n=1 Tax=viral metagenome TaxID=1070528 RepID=A0A6C0KBR1_9ZZZZ
MADKAAINSVTIVVQVGVIVMILLGSVTFNRGETCSLDKGIPTPSVNTAGLVGMIGVVFSLALVVVLCSILKRNMSDIWPFAQVSLAGVFLLLLVQSFTVSKIRKDYQNSDNECIKTDAKEIDWVTAGLSLVFLVSAVVAVATAR